MAQQLIQLVIVPGEGGLPGAALPEGEQVPVPGRLAETVRMDQDTFLPLLGAAHGRQVPLFQPPQLPDLEETVLPDGGAVHAALPGQMPDAAGLQILRKNAHGVIALGGDPAPGTGNQLHIRGLPQPELGKIGGRIGAQRKRHGKNLQTGAVSRNRTAPQIFYPGRCTVPGPAWPWG